MRRYFLDTPVIVGYLRGEKRAIRLIDKLEGILMASVISLAELYEGVNLVENKKVVKKGVKDFFAGLDRVEEVDAEIAGKFGEVRADLRKRGELIEDMDILIAVSALANQAVMVTFNEKHFKRVRRLEIRSGE